MLCKKKERKERRREGGREGEREKRKEGRKDGKERKDRRTGLELAWVYKNKEGACHDITVLTFGGPQGEPVQTLALWRLGLIFLSLCKCFWWAEHFVISLFPRAVFQLPSGVSPFLH